MSFPGLLKARALSAKPAARYATDECRVVYYIIFSTATIGNPAEVSLRFTGRESTPERLALINKSGAKIAGRTLVSLQPSQNANFDASLIALELMQQGLKSLIFTSTKVGAKNLLATIQENLRTRQLGNLTSLVAVFYGSLKSDRRHDIIQRLQQGKVKTIISTNALEAGIDLPEIDCVLVRGWPGSIMSFFQEIGRCGRNRPGLAIFLPVAQNALDSFYGSNPHLLLSSPAESKFFTTPETDLEISLLSQLAEPVLLPTSIEQGRIRLTHYWGQINSKVTGFKLLTKVYEHTCTNPQCPHYHQYPISGQNCRACQEPIRLAEITKMMGETTFAESLTTQFSAPVIKIEINSNLAAALRNYVNQLQEEVQKHSTIPDQYTALWESAPTAIALHSIAHQIILATPLVVLSSSLDIDFIVAKEENHTVGFFFETSHGGSGATDAIFSRFTEFAKSAKNLAENCSCQGGCPRCLTIFRCPQQNRELNKEVGLFLLLTLLSEPTAIGTKR